MCASRPVYDTMSIKIWSKNYFHGHQRKTHLVALLSSQCQVSHQTCWRRVQWSYFESFVFIKKDLILFYLLYNSCNYCHMDNFSHSEILSQAIQRSWIKSHKIKTGIQRSVRLKEGRGKVAIFLSVSELWSWFCNIIMCFSVILNFPCVLFRLCYEDKPEAETLRQIQNIVLDVKTVGSEPHAIASAISVAFIKDWKSGYGVLSWCAASACQDAASL